MRKETKECWGPSRFFIGVNKKYNIKLQCNLDKNKNIK